MTTYGALSDSLRPGVWETRPGGVKVFVEIERLPMPEPTPRREVDLTTLIACVTCRATVTESCRVVKGKTAGAPRSPHWGRLAPRLCPCGELPSGKQATFCRFCALELLRESKRDHMRRARGTVAA